jgi:aldehyde:ferredoxin oxidoreductase
MRGGNILRVDLTSGKVTKEPTSSYEELWLGSRGINTKIIYDEVPPEVKPLEPANVLIFGAGPLTGSMAPGSSRTEITAKSPTIRIQGMSSFGGYFGPELKYAGYDNIVITGRAAKPVYLAINNEDVQIKDASHLWGMDTFDTPVAIRKDLGSPNTQIACIGPAGENLVVYASIQSRVGNGAGRTGMGAVMGSKNLKAIAVRGTKGVSIAEPEKFMEVCREAFRVQKATPTYEEFSSPTASRMVSGEPYDWALVLGNFEASKWDKQKLMVDGLEPFWQEHANRMGDGKIGCFNCQMRCKEYYDITELGTVFGYCNFYASTMWPLKQSDFTSWYELASKCQRNGLDVVATTRMIAWAMELYEKGKISKEDTDGNPLLWGDGDAIIKMVDKIIKREGFGNVLASDVVPM